MDLWFWISLAVCVLVIIIILRHLYKVRDEVFKDYDTPVDGTLTHKESLGRAYQERMPDPGGNDPHLILIKYTYTLHGMEYHGSEHIVRTLPFIKIGDVVRLKAKSDKPGDAVYIGPKIGPKYIVRVIIRIVIFYSLVFLINLIYEKIMGAW